MAWNHSPAGTHKDDLETPALLLDLDAMERNLKRMVAFLAETNVRLRPHVKLHKATPALAHKQLEYGAIGMTCAKLSEAESLVAAGITDILIANQIVGLHKLARLMALARKSQIKVAVDSYENAAALSQAAEANGVRLGVLVEVNIGHNRCGVAPFEPTLALVRHVLALPGLKFMGLMGYDGHATMKVSEAERGTLSTQANTLLAETRKYLEQHGIAVEMVSAGGTFTYRFAAAVQGITEVQAGTYLLMDTAFRDHGVHEFEPTLSVLATIISRPAYPGADGLAVIDTGRKSISTALGNPEIKSPADAALISLSDEHGRVRLGNESLSCGVGDHVELWVRDANGTINQFDRFYALRGTMVEATWEIPLRGVST